MKFLHWIYLWVLAGMSQPLFAQCPPPGFPEPGNTCPLAPVLCENLDGYCATINNNNVVQSFPGCTSGWTLNNDEWFAFFAGTKSIVIQVTPLNCESGPLEGLQGGIYAGCGPPWQIMDVQCPCTTEPFLLSANDFEVGHIYWFVLDGCNGQICDYKIDVLEGSTIGVPPAAPGAVTGPSAGCEGGSSVYTIAAVDSATTYTWTVAPPIGTVLTNSNEAVVIWTGSGQADVCVSVSNGCYPNPVSSCTTVDVVPKPAATLSGNGSLCPGTNDSVNLVVNFTGSAPWRFRYARNGILQNVIVTSSNPYVFQVVQPGTYTLLDIISLSADCPGPGTVSGSVAVTLSNSPDWVLNIDSVACAGGSFSIFYRACNLGEAVVVDSLPVTFYRSDPSKGPTAVLGTYFFSGTFLPGDCRDSVLTSPAEVLFPNGAGTLQRPFGIINDDGSLPTPFSLDSFPVTHLIECNYLNNVRPKGYAFSIAAVDIGPDPVVCKNNAWTFTPTPGFVDYRWQDGSTAAFFTTSTPGTYWVEARDACGFTYRDTAVMTVQTPPFLQIPDSAVCPGETASVAAPGGLASYQWAPATGINCTSCPGVNIQPAATTEYVLTAADSIGCVSRDSFVITVLPQPVRSQTFVFCPGQSVTIGGQAYTQPGVVLDTLPAATGCDTLATFLLQHEPLPQPSNVSIQCPPDVTVQIPAGAGSGAVSYSAPTAGTDCPCGTVAPVRTQGPASGAAFSSGLTQVCYRADDACGNAKTCCFTVRVENAPSTEEPCDVKNTPCLKFEILGIFQNPAKQKTYRLRVTNQCTGELVHLLFQLPDGIVADKPVTSTVYAAPSGRLYDVRNPNFSPFYSIRFKSAGTGIAGGQSDIFEYTLPPEANPLYIHVAARLAPNQFYEAHLNVFNCPVQPLPKYPEAAAREHRAGVPGQAPLRLYPNPATGMLYVDLSSWPPQKVHLLVRDALGAVLLEKTTLPEAAPCELALPEHWANGLYILEVRSAEGLAQAIQFALQR